MLVAQHRDWAALATCAARAAHRAARAPGKGCRHALQIVGIVGDAVYTMPREGMLARALLLVAPDRRIVVALAMNIEGQNLGADAKSPAFNHFPNRVISRSDS